LYILNKQRRKIGFLVKVPLISVLETEAYFSIHARRINLSAIYWTTSVRLRSIELPHRACNLLNYLPVNSFYWTTFVCLQSTELPSAYTTLGQATGL